MKLLSTRVKKPGERSFTLIETVIALSLMTFLIMEVAGVQGNAILFNEYGRRASQASWLARRIMSQVEYNWSTRAFKDLKEEPRDVPFEDMPDYSYTLEIKDWKFPFVQLLLGGAGGGGEDGDDKKDGGMAGMIKSVIEQVFGDEIFKIARVEVFWPEGASRGSVSLAYLITNQAKIDEVIGTMKPVWDELQRKDKGGAAPTASAAPSPGVNPADPNAGVPLQ